MIRHHPADETLARHAAGTLETGPALVVATHVAGCPRCRELAGRFEAVGGALLMRLSPASMKDDALRATLARLDEPAAAIPKAVVQKPAPSNGPIELPDLLNHCEIGKWRWLGPGIRRSRITIPGAPLADVALYRIGANRSLPHHGHAGTEYTQVLSGSFLDGDERYAPGELAEADGAVDHQPRVGPEGECICLAAVEGTMRLHGFFGRLMQPFV